MRVAANQEYRDGAFTMNSIKSADKMIFSDLKKMEKEGLAFN